MFITGFQSCQKETPHLLEAPHEFDQIEPTNRIGLLFDVENELDEVCDCCIRILDFEVNLPEGHYAMGFSGGYNGNTNPCLLEGTQIPCPLFELHHGDCDDSLNPGLCSTKVDANNDSERCHDLHCIIEASEQLFFSAFIQQVDPSDCTEINNPSLPPIEASITFEIICQSNDVKCYDGIDDDGNDGASDNPNPNIPTVTTTSSVGTINLTTFGPGTAFGAGNFGIVEDKCCEVAPF